MAVSTLLPLSVQLQPSLRIIVDGKESVHRLSQSWEEIGRSIQCTIRINHKEVSRHQAIMLRVQDGYQILDGDGLGQSSSNGTYVNGQRIKAQKLQAGDVIHFGSNVVKAIYQEAEHSELPEVQTDPYNFDSDDDVTTELILLQNS